MKENITDNEKKEIEEMARIIKFVQDSQVFHDGEADRKQIATALHNAGYRKQKEVAKEATKNLHLKISSALVREQSRLNFLVDGYDARLAELKLILEVLDEIAVDEDSQSDTASAVVKWAKENENE